MVDFKNMMVPLVNVYLLECPQASYYSRLSRRGMSKMDVGPALTNMCPRILKLKVLLPQTVP